MPTLDDTILLSQYPRSVVPSATGEVVYVSVDNSFAVRVIDTDTNTVVRSIDLGTMRPGLMIGSPDGSQLFAFGATTMAIIDTSTETVRPITLPGSVQSAKLSPDGARLYVTTTNAALAIVVIDTATATIDETVTVPSTATALAVSPGGDYLYYSQSNGLFVMNTSPTQRTSLASISNVTKASLSADGTKLYVVDGSSTISVVDTGTGTVLDTVSSSTQVVSITLSTDGTELYSVNTAYSMDPMTFMQIQTSTLRIIDTSTGDVWSTAPLPWSSYQPIVDPDDGLVWVTGSKGVAVVDPATATTQSIDLVFAIVSVAFLPNTDRAYAVSDGGGRAFALSLAPVPAALSPISRTISATFNEPIVPTGAWSGTGFVGAVTYTVSPALPAGLVLDPASGSVSGTPTGPVQGATDYTVTGTGATSGVATATVTIGFAATAPSAPGAASASAGAGQAFVTWSAPSSNGGAAVSSYTVTASPGGATCTTTALWCVVPGLTAGTSYTFAVTATNSTGTSLASTPSSPVSVVVSVAPSTPPTSTPGTTVRLLAADGSVVTNIVAGQQFFVEVTGFAPTSSVEATLYSTPVRVGIGTTDGAGAARFSVTIPSTLAPGSHTLVVSGFGTSGQTAFAAVGVTTPAAAVPARARLANSGGQSDGSLSNVALVLLSLGGAMVIVARRARVPAR